MAARALKFDSGVVRSGDVLGSCDVELRSCSTYRPDLELVPLQLIESLPEGQ
jgi:hypothetical protein